MSMEIEHCKCVVIGDGAVGKTCMLVAYTDDTFKMEYTPTIFETYTANLIVDNRRIKLALWDTAGQEDFERLRPLSYSETDVFVICYSVALRSSFNNIKAKWIPEIMVHDQTAPFIIVGTKMDLRDDKKPGDFVTYEEAKKHFGDTEAFSLVECSALQQTNLKEVFEDACRCMLHHKDKAIKEKLDKEEAAEASDPIICECVLV